MRATELYSSQSEKRHWQPFSVPLFSQPRADKRYCILSPEVTVIGYHPFDQRTSSAMERLPHPALLRAGIVDTGRYVLTTGNEESLQYALEHRNLHLDWALPQFIEDYCVGFVASQLDGPLTRVIPIGEVILTPQGASGMGYACCRTKTAALTNHWSDVTNYVNNYTDYPPPVFTYMHKKAEVLPREKARTRTRPIIYPPLHFYMLQKVVTQECDDRMKSCPNFFSYGKSVLGRHFSQIAAKLLSYDTLYKGDCKRYDSCVSRDAFRVICAIRKRLAVPEAHPILDFIYEQLSGKMVALPDGRVVYDTRQASGQACTTTDNSLFHCFVVAATYSMHFFERKGRLPTYGEIEQQVAIFLYSDDHIGATNDPEYALFTRRSELYGRLGLVLSPDDDQVGGHISEYIYLGGRFAPHPDLPEYWCYLYEDSDLLEQLLVASALSTEPDIAMALASYARILAVDPRKYNEIVSLARRLQMQPTWTTQISIPRRNLVLTSFLSLECLPRFHPGTHKAF